MRALTIRGRAFLASGVTASICGLVLVERDLVRIGVLVALLPVVALFFVVGRAPDLRLERAVNPTHLAVGEEAEVLLDLRNAASRSGVLLVEDSVPAALGDRPRFVISPLARDARQRLRYTVRPAARGRHTVGPLQVRRREPFGMVEARQSISGTTTLLALPPVTPLTPIRVSGGLQSTGEDSPRSYSAGKVADVIVREYRRGDELRRVHWRSTARRGQLMVRNEERTWQASAMVLLDSRARSHRGTGLGSSLEAAIGAAASVVVHLIGQGYDVTLVTASGVVDAWHERGRGVDPFPLLEALALLQPSDRTELPDLTGLEESAEGMAVGILGATGVEDAAWWARFPRHGAQSLAVALDVDAWSRPSGPGVLPDPPPTWLAAQGWRASTLTKGGSVATAWRELESV